MNDNLNRKDSTHAKTEAGRFNDIDGSRDNPAIDVSKLKSPIIIEGDQFYALLGLLTSRDLVTAIHHQPTLWQTWQYAGAMTLYSGIGRKGK